jgi:tRNA (adenine37-N6)-methyltransferase
MIIDWAALRGEGGLGRSEGCLRREVVPFLDSAVRGVFATRSPKRPNALGLSTVRLLVVEGATLHIAEVDMLDGTPLLDIKPYVPQSNVREGATITLCVGAGANGWFAAPIHRVGQVRPGQRPGVEPGREDGEAP